MKGKHTELLKDKVALVTGSSRGIGAGIVRLFAQHGAKVAVHGRSEDGWRLSIDDNLTATFLSLKSFLPGMKERRCGSIVTISSAAARRAHPATPIPYAAAKAGIIMMTQHLAIQVGPFNIRVNCITPETILTENNRARIPEAQQATLAELHPLRRLGTVEDVAQAALYLASDNASWVTGVVLDVAGGAVIL